MQDYRELKVQRDAVHEEYLSVKKKLQGSLEDSDSLMSLAQAANDAWLKLKEYDRNLQNYSVNEKLKRLYGC